MFRIVLLVLVLGACGDDVDVKEEKKGEPQAFILSGESRECPVWGGTAVFYVDGGKALSVDVFCTEGEPLHVVEKEDTQWLCPASMSPSKPEEETLCVKALGRESEVEEYLQGSF